MVLCQSSVPLVMMSAGCLSILHLLDSSFPCEVFWGQANQSDIEQSVVGLVGSLVMRCSVVCHAVGWLVGLSALVGMFSGWSVGRDNNKRQGQGQQ